MIMKVILSPAKAIDMNRRLNTKVSTVPVYLKEAEVLIGKLRKFPAKKIGKLMDLSADLSELNYQRYQDWKEETVLNDTNAHVSAAFNGEAYRGLDAVSLTEAQLAVAQDKVRILSGLYGVLKPLDVIYPYRLEMGTKLPVTAAKKNLYQFWGSKIAEYLNTEETEVIINAASSEYFKAIDRKKLKARVITTVFKEFKNGEYKVIMVFAKKARGMMARYIVENNLTDPEDIKGFNMDGYRFDENLSKGDEWVFTR